MPLRDFLLGWRFLFWDDSVAVIVGDWKTVATIGGFWAVSSETLSMPLWDLLLVWCCIFWGNSLAVKVGASMAIATIGGFWVVVGSIGDEVDVLDITTRVVTTVAWDLFDLVLFLGNAKTKAGSFRFWAVGVGGISSTTTIAAEGWGSWFGPGIRCQLLAQAQPHA
jgi:hypothetical protein